MRSKMKKRMNELKRMGGWINFPMVDLVNGFGVHWYYDQTSEECELNSFSFKDAAHYALNNVTYSYKDFVELDGDYKRLMDAEAEVNGDATIRENDYVEVGYSKFPTACWEE